MKVCSPNPASAVIVDVQKCQGKRKKMIVIHIFLFYWRKLRPEGLFTICPQPNY